jgi:hypothetical protein
MVPRRPWESWPGRITITQQTPRRAEVSEPVALRQRNEFFTKDMLTPDSLQAGLLTPFLGTDENS